MDAQARSVRELLHTVLLSKGRVEALTDDPRAAAAMGMRLAAVRVAIAAGMLATAYRPLAGFYAMSLVLVGFRIWQRRILARHVQPTGPSLTAS